MTITPKALFPPQPTTVRAQASRLSYDAKNDRIVYPLGKSVFVRPASPDSVSPVIQFSKHLHRVTAALFAPSGNYVALGDESGNIKIWDVSPQSSTSIDPPTFEQPALKSEFQVLSSPIRDIAWDADSQRIIAVGEGSDKFGHCFSWDSGNSIGEIQGHAELITAVSIKPQRPYRAATVSSDKALVFYNGPPFKFDKSIRGHHSNTIRDVEFSPDGKYIVSVGSDRVIALYDGKTGEFIKKIENAHNGGIFGVSWSADSSFFVTASADNTIKQWDAESGESTKEYVVASKPIVEDQQLGVVVSAKYIISLSTNGDINFFESGASGSAPVKVSGVQTAITALSFASSGHLYVGASDGQLIDVSVANGKFTPGPAVFGNPETKHGNYVSGVISTASGQVFLIGWDDTLKLWKNGEIADSVSFETQPTKIVQLKDFLVVLFESEIQVFDQELQLVAQEKLTFNATDIAAYGGDKILVTNTNLNNVEEYQLSAGKISLTRSFPVLRAAPALIRVSPNDKYVAIADSFGKYTLYNAADLSVVTTRWAFHNSKVLDAQWTEDSQYLLSGGLDTGILVYSVGRPAKVLKFLLAHQTGVSGLQWVSYDASGKVGAFVSTGLDGVLKSWDVDFSAY